MANSKYKEELERDDNPMYQFNWPEKIDIDTFKLEVEKSITPFVENMKIMDIPREQWPEHWMDIFKDWFMD